MPLSLRELHKGFAHEVLGLDLGHPLPAVTVAALQDAIDRHGVLVFRGQHLDDTSQIAFARLFGPPERFVLSYRPGIALRLSQPEMVDVSNLDAATGKPQDRHARHRMVNLGNRLWHTDSSFKQMRGALSMLYAHTVPPSGGETEYGDCRTAYDRLPAATQQQIDSLQAQHSLMHSRATLGFADFTPEEHAALPPSVHPLVSVSRTTGRKAIYVASHASHVLDMPIAEGRLLIADLIEAATKPDLVYRHAWQVGDLVVWDNRCTLHRGMPFDESYPRDLRRVTTSDVTSPR